MASSTTIANDSTNTWIGTSGPTRRRIITSAPINPSNGLLFGGALTIALGLLGYNVVVNDQISIATMLILLVSLAGLAYPISEWLRLRKAIRQANRSAARDLRVPGTAARAAPERGSAFPQCLEGSDHLRERRAREPLRTTAARGDFARDTRRFAHRHHGTGRGCQARPGLLDPPTARSPVRPRLDRRP